MQARLNVPSGARLVRPARQAGLAGLKPHDLRNTAAKLRRNNGASIKDVLGDAVAENP